MFKPFWPTLPGPGPNSKRKGFREVFIMETRIKSKSFEPLIGFLGFLVQKFWPEKLTLGKIT